MANTKFHFIRPQLAHTAKPLDGKRGLVAAIQKECDEVNRSWSWSILHGSTMRNVSPAFLSNCTMDIERISNICVLVTFKSEHGEFAKVEAW